jgi:hypothetical protein
MPVAVTFDVTYENVARNKRIVVRGKNRYLPGGGGRVSYGKFSFSSLASKI